MNIKAEIGVRYLEAQELPRLVANLQDLGERPGIVLPWSLQKEHGPAHTLNLDVQHLQL